MSECLLLGAGGKKSSLWGEIGSNTGQGDWPGLAVWSE